MSLFKKHLSPYRAAVAGCVLILVFQAAFSLALPFFMGKLIGVGVEQKGISACPPEVISRRAMELFERALPPDEYKDFISAYDFCEEPPSHADDMVADTHDCYYLCSDADKRAVREKYENAMLCGVLLARKAASDTDAKIKSADIERMQGIVSFSYIYAKINNFDISEEALLKCWQASHDAKASIKKQVAATLLPYFYDDAGVDVVDTMERYTVKTTVAMGVCVLMQCVCMALAGRQAAKISAFAENDLRKDFLLHTSRFTKKELSACSPDLLSAAATADISQIGMTINYSLRLLAYAPILGMGATALSFFISPLLGSIVVATSLLVSLALAGIFKAAVKRYEKLQTAYERLSKAVNGAIAQLFTVRTMRAQRIEERRVAGEAEKIRSNENYVLRACYAALSCVNLLTNAVTAVVVVAGGEKLLNSTLGVGDIVSFLQYSLLTVSAFMTLGAVILFAPRAAVAVERVNRILAVEPSVRETESPCRIAEDAPWDIEFINASVSGVLADVSFTAFSGQVTAVVGATGSGKSTLMELVARMRDADGGEVCIAGKDIRSVELEHLRQNISYAPGKPVLFSKSLRENLLLHGATDDDNAMLAGLRKAQCSFLPLTPDGLFMPIANRGENFSGGQRSRIALAGALAKEARIYIFDDCLTCVDAETERRILENIFALKAHAAVLIVSQRIISIMNADKIVVLGSGMVEAEGTHAELMNASSLYRELAELQENGGECNG